MYWQNTGSIRISIKVVARTFIAEAQIYNLKSLPTAKFKINIEVKRFQGGPYKGRARTVGNLEISQRKANTFMCVRRDLAGRCVVRTWVAAEWHARRRCGHCSSARRAGRRCGRRRGSADSANTSTTPCRWPRAR